MLALAVFVVHVEKTTKHTEGVSPSNAQAFLLQEVRRQRRLVAFDYAARGGGKNAEIRREDHIKHIGF